MNAIRVVGVLYKPQTPKALALAQAISEAVGPGRESWMGPVDGDDSHANDRLRETDLIVTVGGDGTILRAAQAAVAHDVPLLGVNMGRLGFMTELRAAEALERLPRFLEGRGWVEERSMLKVQAFSADDAAQPAGSPWRNALNDAVLGRGAAPRLISVRALIDGALLTSYRADAVIVSAAAGSTGYNLSAGGPILDPGAREMVLKPVAPHVGLATAVVLPSSASVELVVESHDGAVLSVDGFLNQQVPKGDGVRIRSGCKKARFLREGDRRDFYANLTRRLGFEGGMGAGRAIFY